MTAFLALLLLGLIYAIQRASAARRVARLEEHVRALADRIRGLEQRLGGPPESEFEAAAAAQQTPDVPPPLPTPAVEAVYEAAQSDPVPLAVAPPRSRDRVAPGLEELIGGRWLLFAGVAAIVLGMSYFVKFAFDNGWISEPLRVAAGIVTGLVLIGFGIGIGWRGLQLFGQALAGAGVVVLYVSIYAALHFYALIPPAAAFAAMATVTAGAAYLSDRQRSQPLTMLALLGGFATPLLVGGRRDDQVVLFTYMGILICGTAVLARRHTWPLLGAASYLCTLVLVVNWFYSSYEGQNWLTTELFFTVYAGLFAYLLDSVHRSATRTSPQAQLAAAALATAPIAYHLASVIVLSQHTAAWLVYVVLATLTGLVVAQRTGAGWVRVLVLLLVGMPMLVWLEALASPEWYLPAVATAGALYLLHLAAQWFSGTDDPQSAYVSAAHTQLNGLLLPLTLYFFLETRYAGWNPWMTAGLAAWNGGLALLADTRAPRLRLQFIALASTLAAVALVLAFDGPAVAFGWAAEGVLVGWLAYRERRRTLVAGSAILISLGALQLLDLLTSPLPAGDTPFLNPRAFAASLVVAMLAWLAWRIRGGASASVGHLRTALIVSANLLMLALVSADVHAFFAQRAADASLDGELRAVADAGRAEQVALSVTWALYAVGLVFAGIRRRFAPARYLAIGLLAIVIAKVLVVDITGLDRLYRMLSVLGVGVLLLMASYLYQRKAADNRTSDI